MAEVVRSRVGVMTYLAPSGALTEEDALASTREAIAACLEGRELQLVLDLSHVPLLGGTALELLLDTQDRLTRMGGWIRVANGSALIRDIFLVTGVGDYVTFIEADPGAVPPPRAPTRTGGRLGELLVERGLVKPDQVTEALRLQGQVGKRMGQILVDKGWVAERAFFEVLSEQLGVPFVRLRSGLWDSAALDGISADVARRLRVLPLFRVRGVLVLATADPQSMPSFEELEDLTGCKVKPVLACREEIVKSIGEAYTGDSLSLDYMDDAPSDLALVDVHTPDDYAAIDEQAAGSPVINLANAVIQRAVRDGASDIHIEPSRTKCRIRLRIDGVLYEVMTQRIEVHPALVSRLKVMANVDIAERRLPQDGRIQVFTQGRTVDLRFSSLPGIFGEKVVLRVLDKNQSILDVNKLGMAPATLDTFKGLLARSYGLILVTGPTGSGKTTTLYAAINQLNSIEKNIVTIEDPVEYQIDVVNQNQVKESVGLTFAKVLKHVLRQDPDIVMVGEIRERETAHIAVQAALTGHLVLSTLHTNDSVGALTRMLEMGIEPYLLTSALIGVVAQRLVRRVCPGCRVSYLAPPALVQQHGWEEGGSVRLSRGRGCPDCYDSGFKGRAGIHEILAADGELQRVVMNNPTRDDLARHMAATGVRTLFHDGLDKARQGVTTVEEVSRVVNIQ